MAAQIGVCYVGGMALANALGFAGWEPSYSDAPKFYFVCFAFGGLFLLHHFMIVANKVIEWQMERSEAAGVDLGMELLEPLDDGGARSPLGDGVPSLGEDARRGIR